MTRARLLAAALALAGTGFSPFQAEEPNVREGNERVAAGDAPGALPHYDAAERAAGARAEIDYDRGVALFRQGKTAEARDAFRKVLDRGAGALTSRASQNLGNALAAAGDRPGAVKAFTEALRADPKNEDARFDLEVLLRQEQEEQRKKQEQQRAEKQRPPQSQQQQDASRDQKPGDQDRGAPQDRGAESGESSESREAKAPDARAGQPGQAGEPGSQGTAAADGRLTREEAARILDAFRSHDEAAPSAGTRRRATWRGHAGRDW